MHKKLAKSRLAKTYQISKKSNTKNSSIAKNQKQRHYFICKSKTTLSSCFTTSLNAAKPVIPGEAWVCLRAKL
jgi:hypothetical protein